MPEHFNADEVFEIAEQIERNGARFYRRSAEITANTKTRELLLELAGMEERHERIFAALRSQLWKENPNWLARFFDADGESQAALYLRAVAAGHIFDLKTDPTVLLTGKEPLKAILRTAIALEKDSVVFYLSIQQAMPTDLGRDKLDDVIQEEIGHVTMLSTELAALEV